MRILIPYVLNYRKLRDCLRRDEIDIVKFLDTFPPAYIDMNASYSFLLLQIIYDIERRNPFFMGINLLPSFNKYYNSGYLEHRTAMKLPT